MTKREGKPEPGNWKALLAGDEDYLRRMIEAAVQATARLRKRGGGTGNEPI